ncbi:MAG TPA: glycoside hydrolase family 88 protein [bacterium]|nr:glycoside hydrolase family 88 protein [bacterium]HPR89077.1 glycoside hydrolase family 88 protein [bacterium]
MMRLGLLLAILIPALVAAAPGGESGWEQLPLILQRIVPPSFPSRDFDITDFGAHGDGRSDCTAAIRAAIAACADSGGGRVVVPDGTFLTGAIHLRSHVNLHLAAGATLRFSTDPAAYLPVVFTRFEGAELMNYSPFIYAYDQEEIAITGTGTLDGQGGAGAWWDWKKNEVQPVKDGPNRGESDRDRLVRMNREGIPVAERVFGPGYHLRPNFIQPYQCRSVLIEGVRIINSPMWEIHPVLCTNVTVRGVIITSHGPNNDGCDPESCRDVLIENCSFDTGDDCIAIKSGRNEDGRRINVPSDNIIIRGCRMKEGHGGVVIGSEISGNCRNVFAEECVMDSPNLERALRIKTNSYRGGVVENIFMRHVRIGEVKEAVLLVDLNYQEGDGGAFTPVVRAIRLENVTSTKSRYALHLVGYERSPVQDIRLSDCRFDGVEKENVLRYVTGLQLERVFLNGQPVGATPLWAERMAGSVMQHHPRVYDSWDYVTGTVLTGFEALWRATGDAKYFNYIKSTVDSVVSPYGAIAEYKGEEFNIDEVREGTNLLFLARETGELRYKVAADLLREQLRGQPRTQSGGFWHKQRYPWQMWLDGLYMGSPFYAAYAVHYHEPAALNDVVRQFVLMEEHGRDPRSGLLYHGWDESRQQRWADPRSGCSANFWGRGVGWYAMALVDVLDDLPAGHTGRDTLVQILKRLAPAIARCQDPATGLWWQVLDQGGREGNYLESSASAMFVYALAKGVRCGYLDAGFISTAEKGFQGMIARFIRTNPDGTISLTHTCKTAGLGYGRDGSYDYYVHQTEYGDDDGKGVGAFILAAVEMELLRKK